MAARPPGVNRPAPGGQCIRTQGTVNPTVGGKNPAPGGQKYFLIVRNTFTPALLEKVNKPNYLNDLDRQ